MVVAARDGSTLREAYQVHAHIALNLCSSIASVFADKVVFEIYDFRFGILLALIQLVFASLVLELCRRCGVFEAKRLSVFDVLPLSVSFVVFLSLTHLSLQYNSVGVFQLMKVLTTPVVVLLLFTFYGAKYGLGVLASLVLICTGMVVLTVTDFELSFIGTVVAVATMPATALYQIWVGSKQRGLECSPLQLLYYHAPLCAALLLPIALLLGDYASVEQQPWPPAALCVALLVSSSLALLVNVSVFLVIESTTAVGYNVLGHSKLTLLLVLGIVVFGQPLEWRSGIGIVLAAAGVLCYLYVK